MNALLAALALILGTAVAAAVTGGPGAVVLCAAAAFLAGLAIARAGDQKRFLLQIFVAGLLVRVVVGTVIFTMSLQEFFGGDALTYDALGSILLDHWRAGTPPAHLNEWANSGGGWGMLYLVAMIYGAVGRNMLAVQFFNAVVGAATAPVIFLCARHIFNNLRVAKVAAFSVALYPSLVLWSSQGLKDGPIVFLLALSMLATLKLGERLSWKYMVVLVAALSAIITLRFYIFYMLAAAIGGAFLVGMKALTSQSLARQVFIVAAAGLAFTYLGVLRNSAQQLETYATFETIQRTRADLAGSAQSGFGRDVDVSTTSGALSVIPTGFVYLMFAPFPWQVANLRQSITIPEMVAWWASFPLLVAGIWFTLRHRLRQALPILLFTTMLTLAYSVFQGNVGTAYRQRSQVLVFYFIFVAAGAVLVKEASEERTRRVELARRVVAPERRAAEARRRYERWKHGREQELEKIARDISERLTS